MHKLQDSQLWPDWDDFFFIFKDVYILYREAQYGQIKGSQMQKKKKDGMSLLQKRKRHLVDLKSYVNAQGQVVTKVWLIILQILPEFSKQ